MKETLNNQLKIWHLFVGAFSIIIAQLIGGAFQNDKAIDIMTVRLESYQTQNTSEHRSIKLELAEKLDIAVFKEFKNQKYENE